MSIEIEFPKVGTQFYHHVIYDKSFRGRISRLRFNSTTSLSMGKKVRIYYNERPFFEGIIVDRSYSRDLSSYQYVAIERVGKYLDMMIKKKPMVWRNMLPEEIIAEIWRYTVNPPYIILPYRGWMRAGFVLPEKQLDEDSLFSNRDDYSLRWELSVDRWGYPLHSLISRDILYESWNDMVMKTDYGSSTTGKLIRWRFRDGPSEYYVSPDEGEWTHPSWNLNTTLSKLKLIRFNSIPTTGLDLPISLTTNQSDYSDIIGFTYPSLSYVMLGVTDGHVRIKWPNEDRTLLLFYYGNSTLTGNPSDTYTYRAWAYAYDIPASLAGSYREEYFHLIRGAYLVYVDNSSGGDTITVTLDDDPEKSWIVSNGNILNEHITLTSGKHKIKIEVGASYTGGSYVKIGGDSTIEYNITDYDEATLPNFINESGLIGAGILFTMEDTSPGAPDLVNLWFDDIYINIKDEFIRQLSGENRKISSILSDIAQTGWVIKYRDDFPIFIRETNLPLVKVDKGFINRVELEETYDNYVSSVRVYGCTKDIVGEARIDNPIFNREIVLTIPWITSSDEAQRYAEKILQRYSVLREIGNVVLVGIFPQFLEPKRVIFDHPLISDTPLSITSVRFDFDNMLTTLSVDIPLNDFLDWLKQTYERQNIEVSYSCPSGCQTTCEMGCETAQEHTSCDPTCETNCQSSCEESCQTTCEQGTSCENSCEVGTTCEESCELNCQETCEIYTGCQQTCEESCQTTCETSCQDTCETTCQTTCETSCQTAEECSCETTCQALCEDSSFEAT